LVAAVYSALQRIVAHFVSVLVFGFLLVGVVCVFVLFPVPVSPVASFSAVVQVEEKKLLWSRG